MTGKEENNVEIKLKTFGRKQKDGPVILVVNACCSHDLYHNVVGVCFVGQDMTQHKMVLDKYTRIQGDYSAIIRNPCALIPPIFMIDEYGCCSEWNTAMQEISGLKREDAIGKMLIGEVFTVQSSGCRVKDHNTLTKLRIILNGVIAGQDVENFLFGLYDAKDNYMEALLYANKKADADGKLRGVLCFLHVASPELQHALQVQRMSEQASMNILKELDHLRQEIRNPLRGIVFTRNLMEASELSEQQTKLIRTSALCQEQLAKILGDVELENIEQWYVMFSYNYVSCNTFVVYIAIFSSDICTCKNINHKNYLLFIISGYLKVLPSDCRLIEDIKGGNLVSDLI